MPRIRAIKPEFFTDSDLCELPPLHRILFEGLWVWGDKAGRLEDKPKELKAKILPYDDCNVDGMLDDLARAKGGAGFIVRYQVGNKRLIQCIKFGDHQRPHKDEKESSLPPPADCGINREISRQTPQKPEAPPSKRGPQELLAGVKTPVSGVLLPVDCSLVLEANPPSAPPAPAEPQIPLSAYRTDTPAAAFFAWAQHERHAHGLPTEKVPKLEKLRTWFSEAMSELRGDEDWLKRTYARFTEDPHWKDARPPWPFNAFISQWKDNVPQAGNENHSAA